MGWILFICQLSDVPLLDNLLLLVLDVIVELPLVVLTPAVNARNMHIPPQSTTPNIEKSPPQDSYSWINQPANMLLIMPIMLPNVLMTPNALATL